MEVAGLAIGIVGIASLFSTCLELVDKVETYRDFGRDSHHVAVRFKAEKLRFEQWGNAVGVAHAEVVSHHHPALDDTHTLLMVEELLLVIQEVCSDAERKLPPQQGKATGGSNKDARALMTPNPNTSIMKLSLKGRKLSWALGGKDKQVARVEEFADLVQLLHYLVPPEQAANSDLRVEVRTEHLLETGRVATEIRETLSKLMEKIEGEKKSKLYAWLGHHSSLDIYENSLKRRLDGTCQWMLDGSALEDWLSPEAQVKCPRLLWINGAAGFGKTVLCARLVEYLLENLEKPVAHFFLSSDSASRDDPYLAIRSWVAQLISEDETAFHVAYERYSTQEELVATRDTVTRVFYDIVQAVPDCHLVLDGLDECAWLGHDGLSNSSSSSVADFLDTIIESVAGTSTRVLLVSRDEYEIRSSFGAAGATEIKISPEDVGPDLALYARSIVDKTLGRKDEIFKDSLAQKMTNRCEGQFLWLRMQEGSLRATKTKKQLERIIDSTAPGLDRLYERDWERIISQHEEDRNRAISLLRWAAFALRPLTIVEITEAVLIDDSYDDFPEDEMPDELTEDYINEQILGICGSLLEVRNSTEEPSIPLRTVHLAHFSVKQFFLSRNPMPGLQANESLRYNQEALENATLAKACLEYIGYQQSWGAVGGNGTSLRSYAAGSWYQHTSLCGDADPSLVKYLIALFDEGNSSWNQWTKWYGETNNLTKSETSMATQSDPLYYASRLGLKAVVEHLLSTNKYNINANSTFGQTPLGVACANGHLQIVEALLNAKADPAVVDDELKRPPMCNAAIHGHTNIVQLLLDKGADLSVSNAFGWTPLLSAADGGHLETVKLLLRHGASLTDVNDNGSTPLYAAATSGHVQVAKLLIESGADTTISNNKQWTAINSAANNGDLDMVTLLLQHKNNINQVNYLGWGPLNCASDYGFLKVVKILLEHGADTSSVTQSGWTPVNCASESGHFEVVKLLLEHGADITVENDTGWTPLNSAANKGHVDIVKLLLEHGADVNKENKSGWTPLNCASDYGFLAVVKALLEKGADYTIINKDGWTPVNSAADSGHVEIVKLLLEHGADISVVNGNGWTPLNAAADNGHLEVVKFLLENGADMTVANTAGWTPLNSASDSGHLEVVKLLLEKGADWTVANNAKWTPLNSAADTGHLEVVKLLFEKGADIWVPNADGWTPLISASHKGHVPVVKFLIEKGADPTIADNEGWTPLASASSRGHTDVVKFLLEHGADINVPNAAEWTPLNLAANHGHLDATKVLIENGGDLEAPSNSGWAPLNIAADHGHLEIVKVLLDKGASVTTVTDKGWTPLNSAADSGHLEIVRLLLERGASLNGTSSGWSPIHAASDKGHLEIVKILLASGASIDDINYYGWTPVNSAADSGHIEIVKLLVDKGADITIATKNGSAPLASASSGGHLEVVEYLASTGADTSARDLAGRTAYMRACMKGYSKLVEFFSERYPAVTAIKDNNGRVGLFQAARSGHRDAVQYILTEYPEQREMKDNYDSTAVFSALRNGHLSVVELLLTADDISGKAVDIFGKTLKDWADEKGIPDLQALTSHSNQPTDSTVDESEEKDDASEEKKNDESEEKKDDESEEKKDDEAAPSPKTLGWCDVCTRNIPAGTEHYICDACDGGDFYICMDCFEARITCQDPSHKWRLKKPDSE